MNRTILAAAVVFLSGCASNSDAIRAHYEAQAAAHSRPLVELEAQDGQTITLHGVRRFVVNAPGGEVQQYREQHHPAWSIVSDAIRIGAPIYLGGQAAIGLADVVGRRVGDVSMSPTVVTQPPPLVVDPVIVEQPPYNDPVIVEQPQPLVVEGLSE